MKQTSTVGLMLAVLLCGAGARANAESLDVMNTNHSGASIVTNTTASHDTEITVLPDSTNLLVGYDLANYNSPAAGLTLDAPNIDFDLQTSDASELTSTHYFMLTSIGSAGLSVLYALRGSDALSAQHGGDSLLVKAPSATTFAASGNTIAIAPSAIAVAAPVPAPVAATVPEPATMLLLGSGLAGVAANLRRRRRKTIAN